MKKKLFLSLTALLSSVMLFSCGGNTSSANVEPSTSINDVNSQNSDSVPNTSEDNDGCISIAKAIELAGTDSSYTTPEKYYVRGTVKEVSNSTYGNMIITDGVNELSIYGCYSADGTVRYDAMEQKPVAGDTVKFYGNLTYYKQAEMKDAWLIEMHHETPVVSDEDYKEMDLATAHAKPADSLVKVKGVVAKITYASGMNPNGFYITDETGSMYCYDSQVAQQVKVGNKVTVAGTKVYFIAENEATNAATFGYGGCNQITDLKLLENDNGTNELNFGFAQSKTIKEIMDTPVNEDITNVIYKTYGFIKKAENPGYINYYFNDIDGKTGSYAYTACNGSDYSWLDQYDGKLVNMYLTAINAKSSNAGCVYRLVPISVGEEYTVPESYYPEYAIKYEAFNNVKSTYEADPELSFPNKVSNELLNVNDITIEYSSSNTEVISFEKGEEATVMHLNAYGEASITAVAKYGDNEYTLSKNIKYKEPGSYDYVNVSSAVASEDGTEVVVKGIVGPSATNQKAFYLIDDTGIVAVRTTQTVLDSIKQGNEVIIKGTKNHVGSSDTAVGQIVIDDSEVLTNLQGNHPYSKTSFKNVDSLQTLYDLPSTEDHSAQGYHITGKLKYNVQEKYTNASFLSPDGTIEMSIYCSSGSQLSWAEEYADQELEYDVAVCNWNKKSYYRLVILSLTTSDGKVITNPSAVKTQD